MGDKLQAVIGFDAGRIEENIRARSASTGTSGETQAGFAGAMGADEDKFAISWIRHCILGESNYANTLSSMNETENQKIYRNAVVKGFLLDINEY